MAKRVQLKTNGGNESSNGGSRPRNSPKKPTYSLADGILAAADKVGNPDRQGRGGRVGYLEWLAVRDPRTFGMLLATHLRQNLDSHVQKPRFQTPGLNDGITPENAGEALMAKISAVGKRLKEERRAQCAEFVVRSGDFTQKRFRNCQGPSPAW
jgi:hypothetical protein